MNERKNKVEIKTRCANSGWCPSYPVKPCRGGTAARSLSDEHEPPPPCFLHSPKARGSVILICLTVAMMEFLLPVPVAFIRLTTSPERQGTGCSYFPQHNIRLARNVCLCSRDEGITFTKVQVIGQRAHQLWEGKPGILAFFFLKVGKGEKCFQFFIFCHFLNTFDMAILHFLLISSAPSPRGTR